MSAGIQLSSNGLYKNTMNSDAKYPCGDVKILDVRLIIIVIDSIGFSTMKNLM